MENLKVLCIDDEESIRYALSAVIQSQDWTALTAKNVKEGLQIINRDKPDIILIDYHMPDINGIEGVKLIRKDDLNIPIIVFTIDFDQEVADKFMEAGATDFATKPIKAPDLISRINLHIKLLKDQKGRTESPIESLELVKGIGENTLNLLLEKMRESSDYLTVEEISDLTELSYQTTYRYLQFLESEEIINVKISYGKIGRPKQSYLLKTGI